ncbi:MAG: serine O-acetyltransferase EpsC [Balneolaceae bacterium]
MKRENLTELYNEHKKAELCPSPILVADFFNNLLGFLFPEFSTHRFDGFDEFESFYGKLGDDLFDILSKRMDHDPRRDRVFAPEFLENLPSIKKELRLDVEAMYRGDPAARSLVEVVRAYPGFYAIASYRIAHFLHENNLGLIARMITENAHSRTGIDIHPGARIGRSFCIDHGTGIVIGETTEIGNHVKVYQGVTLGALSVKKEDAAKKRHPTIRDHVVIYAGASILGGETVVGHHSIVGGNVWLTQSVPPYSKVYYKAEFINEIDGKGKSVY